MPRGVLPERPVAARIARELRQTQTPAEKAMWKLLRDRRLRGLKFRRQFPIGTFIADFCCYDCRLVIELDGEVHETRPQQLRDENRDIYLSTRGYIILRFSNQRVFQDPSGVLEDILLAGRPRGFTGAIATTEPP